jgi:4-carboxymuconolactone decarboxylase
MYRLLALYNHPADPAYFKKYYEEVHLPLAAQLPGLVSSNYSLAIDGAGATAPYFCVWEGDFASEAAMQQALDSAIGQKVQADIANYASGGLTLVHFDVKAHAVAKKATPASLDASQAFEAGMQIRRDMFGPSLADDALNNATDFNRTLEELVTRYCFGEVWTRPLLDHRTRSMLTVTLLLVLNKPNQLKSHIRGAIANGVTKEEISEILIHAMIYAGVPAAYDGCNQSIAVLKEMGLD